MIRYLYGWGPERLRMPLPEPTDAAAVGRAIGSAWVGCEDWKRSVQINNDDAPDAFLKRFEPAILELIKKAHQKNTARAFLLALEDWMKEAARNFGLGPIGEVYALKGGRVIHSTGSKFVAHFPPPIPLAPAHIRKAAAEWREETPPAQIRDWSGILWTE